MGNCSDGSATQPSSRRLAALLRRKGAISPCAPAVCYAPIAPEVVAAIVARVPPSLRARPMQAQRRQLAAEPDGRATASPWRVVARTHRSTAVGGAARPHRLASARRAVEPLSPLTMRRTTLGPVHSSAFNSDSRASLGGSKSRMSVGGPTRRGRASMAPTAGGGAAAAASSRRDSMASRRGSVAGPASGR